MRGNLVVGLGASVGEEAPRDVYSSGWVLVEQPYFVRVLDKQVRRSTATLHDAAKHRVVVLLDAERPLAILGRGGEKALSALRQGIDEGLRMLWWYFARHDPSVESLHDEPEFQAMGAEIEADMAEQLARVREMERNGELEPIPEVSATTQ